MERLFAASLGMGELLTVYLGDTLGFYRTLDRVGAMSSTELAKEAGTSERLTREWLEQQAAAGILDVEDSLADADARRYRPPAVMPNRCSISTARTDVAGVQVVLWPYRASRPSSSPPVRGRGPLSPMAAT
mgnify:CR=1 FL=1